MLKIMASDVTIGNTNNSNNNNNNNFKKNKGFLHVVSIK